MPTIEKKTTGREVVSRFIYYVLRVLVLLDVLLLFLPSANPARIYTNINRNLSLFTTGFFYNILTDGLGRAMTKGWISAQAIKLDYFSSMLCCFAALAAGAGGCISIGNNKLKRIGNLLSLLGGAAGAGGVYGIVKAKEIAVALAAANPSYAAKASPNADMTGITIFFIMTIGIAVLSLIELILVPSPAKGEKAYIEPKFQLFLMFMPFAILVFVFSYLPLWGWRYAFFDYKAGQTLSMDSFVGFKWFTIMFKDPQYAKHIGKVMVNTLAMSGLGILTSWLPMAFAIFLSEIKSTRIRRFIQTCTTLPNFISWVLVYAVAFCIFSTDGFISSLFVQQGFWTEGKNMLMSGSNTWLKMLAWGIWKSLGWNAIIYISAISGIDQQLYEAATVDGAGRFQKMWHVTVPELIPTYCVLLTLQIAGILSNGMEQYLCFENPQNTAAIEVLDLYVYKIGINGGLIPLSTVVGMLKSVISVALLFVANSITKTIRGSGVV